MKEEPAYTPTQLREMAAAENSAAAAESNRSIREQRGRFANALTLAADYLEGGKEAIEKINQEKK